MCHTIIMPSTQDTHSHEMKNIMYVENWHKDTQYTLIWNLPHTHTETPNVHTLTWNLPHTHTERHPIHTLSHETFQTYRDTQYAHMKPSQTQIQRHPIHSHEIIGTFHTHTHTHTPNTLMCQNFKYLLLGSLRSGVVDYVAFLTPVIYDIIFQWEFNLL
jgi:hypothetical protein